MVDSKVGLTVGYPIKYSAKEPLAFLTYILQVVILGVGSSALLDFLIGKTEYVPT